ncbi:N-formylglutamate deformylase [Azospirillum thermophilum]|uniref:N-formylglutamate deformylase n=1 Tax=Azospirillum thermophilum TaxID=2202148 RepID=A0A2S2CY75_9PROT|nr:N-formylglutamate deformylase [Azospirillum thermophilum]AWK89408.1 N-formylglutamate deformylase [Azospirillum thermophilum]
MEVFGFRAARRPVLVSMPHVGTALPDGFADRLVPAARGLCDTDWHLPQLYDFLEDLGVGLIQARYSRFVIDLNRPSDDTPLYSGATTGLCPSTLFDGQPLYLQGAEPDKAEVARRVETYWRPYHEALTAEMTRLRERFGRAVLFDAHSIRSVVPRLFEGRLPDLNLGTNDGRSLDAGLGARLEAVCAAAGADGFTHVRDGRFKGGHITRHFGRPDEGWHAVQLEMAQLTYMREEPPFAFDGTRAGRIRPHLRRFVETLAAWADGKD